MNKSQVLFYLSGARFHLEQMMQKIKADEEGEGFPVLAARLPFVYRDLNRAWNRREMSDEEIMRLEPGESERLCRFPDDLKSFISD